MNSLNIIFGIDMNMFTSKIIVLSSLLMMLFSNKGLSQEVSIENIVQKDQKVYVYYTLEGNSQYDVKLYYASFEVWLEARNLSGDFGTKQKGGKKTKLIIWDVLSDREELVGSFNFKVTATDMKAQKQIANTFKKNQEKKYLHYPDRGLHYSCNPTRSPFGISYFQPLNEFPKLGVYIDIKTDFRMYAPGEWALRGRSWITGTMGANDSGNDQISGGGTDLIFCSTYQFSGKKNQSSNLLLGATIADTPVFDIFPTSYSTYYSKSHSLNEIYFTLGYYRQTSSGFSYGFTYGKKSLSLFIGGSISHW
jgi:hypothetical protein